MKNKAKELEGLIEIFKSDFSGLEESLTSIRISEDKWTLKEIIGHLIDSASNNHQRFVRFQLSSELQFPDYKNTQWLAVEKHQEMKFSDILSLFYYFNKLIANIISNVDDKSLNNRWNVSFKPDSTFITFEELINHYIDHMKWHLNHFRERLNEVEQK